ncbi:hypothetical protein D3C85_1577160 [compost metagenome]
MHGELNAFFALGVLADFIVEVQVVADIIRGQCMTLDVQVAWLKLCHRRLSLQVSNARLGRTDTGTGLALDNRFDVRE